ncbi:hypothetical protein CEXT_381911 [Caerostris extrusa]|uniref:Uncharacterized protein n=1 Tax=Caerostris extrusa TaxID=172846 RepID=A0AAV4WDF4_CAEEX|nr:hypothetical protein CEXT_381911 [Caerostris extrusa]
MRLGSELEQTYLKTIRMEITLSACFFSNGKKIAIEYRFRSSKNIKCGLPGRERWRLWEISGVRFHCPSVSKQRNTFNDSPESFNSPHSFKE